MAAPSDRPGASIPGTNEGCPQKKRYCPQITQINADSDLLISPWNEGEPVRLGWAIVAWSGQFISEQSRRDASYRNGLIVIPQIASFTGKRSGCLRQLYSIHFCFGGGTYGVAFIVPELPLMTQLHSVTHHLRSAASQPLQPPHGSESIPEGMTAPEAVG